MIFIPEFFLLQEPYIYFLILGIAIGVGLIIFRKMKMETKDKFKPQSLSDVLINENFKPYVNNFGRKLKKGRLFTQFKNIQLRKQANIRLKFCEVKTFKQGAKKGTDEVTNKEGNFIIFKTGNSFLCDVPILNHLVKESEYILINEGEKVLIKDQSHDVWTTNNNIFFYRFAGVWICSKETQGFITELIFKKMLENEKEEGINYIKRIVFYNDQYAQKVGVMEQDHELEKDKWKDRVQTETGVKRR